MQDNGPPHPPAKLHPAQHNVVMVNPASAGNLPPVGRPVAIYPMPQKFQHTSSSPQAQGHFPSPQPVQIEYVHTENVLTARSEQPITNYFEYPHEFAPFRIPVNGKCPMCGYIGRTTVSYEVGDGTYVTVLVLCLLMMPAALLPCCFDSYKDAVHRCLNCGRVLGTSKYCT